MTGTVGQTKGALLKLIFGLKSINKSFVSGDAAELYLSGIAQTF